jgi:hypothetical protein
MALVPPAPRQVNATPTVAATPLTTPAMKPAAAEGDDDDLSPDEAALWNWCRRYGVYVAVGVGVLLVFLRAVSKPPAD